jgi:hypothetical protein
MKRHPLFQFLVLGALCASLAVAVHANTYVIGPFGIPGECQDQNHFPRDRTMYGMEAGLDASYGAGSDFFEHDDPWCGHVSGYATHPQTVGYAQIWAQFEFD